MTAPALQKAVQDRKCVTHPRWQHHCSAAFVVSMQFRVVMAFLPKIKIYKPKKNEASNPRG